MSIVTAKNQQKYYGNDRVTFAFSEDEGLTTFVQPYANTNGVILYSYSMRGGSRQPLFALMVATSAPVLDEEFMIAGNHTNYTTRYSDAAIALPFYIPPAHGLYLFIDSGGIESPKGSVCYEILPVCGGTYGS